MTDIVEQLKPLLGKSYIGAAKPEIAAAITEIERLRKALREIDFYSTDPWARNKIRITLPPATRGSGEMS